MKKINEFWEKRSQKYGNRIEGVLLKSVPLSVNRFLNDWMYKEIDVILKNSNLKILDVGCGYGRLTKQIVDKYPKITVFGIDISRNYIDIFNKSLGPKNKAFQSDIKKLPFEDNSFDVIFIVTTLMYMGDKFSQQQAVSEVFRVLKKGGSFVIIERCPLGYSIFTLGGLINKIRRKKHSEIPAVSFTPSYLTELINKSNGIVKKKHGLPIFTLSFQIIFSLSLINERLGKLLLDIINVLDIKLENFYFPSLYISYTGKKKS